MRVILDTNVIVDALQNRMPWAPDGIAIFRAVATRQITGCITTKQIADIHFFSRKVYEGEKNTDAKARQVTGKLLHLFEPVDTLGEDCQTALGINNGDYEDAILIASATRDMVNCIVTRNPDHFKESPVPVYSPSAFVSMLNEKASLPSFELRGV